MKIDQDIIKQFAEQFGVPEASLKSFFSFFIDNLERNPKIVEWMMVDPEACVRSALENWDKATRAYFEKLLDHNSQEYKNLSSQVYNELRAKVGNNKLH